MDQRVRMIGALTPNRKNSPPRSHARAPARSCALPALCSRACLEGNFALRRPSPPSNPPSSHPMPANTDRVRRSDEPLRSPPPPAASPQPGGATASGRSGSPPPPAAPPGPRPRAAAARFPDPLLPRRAAPRFCGRMGGSLTPCFAVQEQQEARERGALAPRLHRYRPTGP